jgi:hypothetical protein
MFLFDESADEAVVIAAAFFVLLLVEGANCNTFLEVGLFSRGFSPCNVIIYGACSLPLSCGAMIMLAFLIARGCG